MAAVTESTIGGLLAGWRRARRMSQLELALEAGVSARHLSFVETGRARPSRDMVLILSRALRLPPRERNGLLLAAGFAPLYRETRLDDPQMAQALATVALILRRQEPYPAVALDRHWDIVMCNPTYARLVARILPDGQAGPPPLVLTETPRLNALRLLFGPAGFRTLLDNWEAVARAVLARVRREIGADRDPKRRALLTELLSYPDVPDDGLDADAGPDLIVPVDLRDGARVRRLLSMIATLGTAQDITLQDLRIELFYPADAAEGGPDQDRA